MPQTGFASSALTAMPSANFLPRRVPRLLAQVKKVCRRHPSRCCGPEGCGGVRLRHLIAIEAAMVAGSKSNRRRHMAHIGTFQANSTGFEGEVFMVPLSTKGVRVVKETKPNRNPKAPSHRIFVGRSEIGQAWPKTTDDNRDYLSLTFDFAGLNRPIYAILIKDPDSESYGAYWSRAKKPVFE
jgi:uncharacterized protein (DUF736 family)